MPITFQPADPGPQMPGIAQGMGALQQQEQQQKQLQPFLLQQQHAQLQAQLSQTQLTQTEQMNLQRMQNAIGAVNANDNLSDEEKHDAIMQLQTHISPLQMRAAAAAQQHTQLQNQQMQQHLAQQDSLQNQQRQFLTGGAIQALRPIQGQPGLWQMDQHGMLHNVNPEREQQEHELRIEHQRNQNQLMQQQFEMGGRGMALTPQVRSMIDRHIDQQLNFEQRAGDTPPAWAATPELRAAERARRIEQEERRLGPPRPARPAIPQPPFHPSNPQSMTPQQSDAVRTFNELRRAAPGQTANVNRLQAILQQYGSLDNPGVPAAVREEYAQIAQAIRRATGAVSQRPADQQPQSWWQRFYHQLPGSEG